MALTCRGDSERWERCGEERRGRNPQSCSAHSPSGQTQCVGCEGSLKKIAWGLPCLKAKTYFVLFFFNAFLLNFPKKEETEQSVSVVNLSDQYEVMMGGRRGAM